MQCAGGVGGGGHSQQYVKGGAAITLICSDTLGALRLHPRPPPDTPSSAPRRRLPAVFQGHAEAGDHQHAPEKTASPGAWCGEARPPCRTASSAPGAAQPRLQGIPRGRLAGALREDRRGRGSSRPAKAPRVRWQAALRPGRLLGPFPPGSRGRSPTAGCPARPPCGAAPLGGRLASPPAGRGQRGGDPVPTAPPISLRSLPLPALPSGGLTSRGPAPRRGSPKLGSTPHGSRENHAELKTTSRFYCFVFALSAAC